MTPQTLEAAVEIKDAGVARDIMVEDILDLVGDELPISQVPFIFFNI